MSKASWVGKGSGLRAPAHFIFALFIVGGFQPAEAQPIRQSVRAQSISAPGQLTSLKLLRSTLAAVDHANKTGNYTVLRDLGSPGFQLMNSAAGLAAVFARIRESRTDLSDMLLVQPAYDFAPALFKPGVLRMRGKFKAAGKRLGFDLVYQWQDGWMLHGIAIQPLD